MDLELAPTGEPSLLGLSPSSMESDAPSMSIVLELSGTLEHLAGVELLVGVGNAPRPSPTHSNWAQELKVVWGQDHPVKARLPGTYQQGGGDISHMGTVAVTQSLPSGVLRGLGD